jgi:transposase
MKWYKQGMSLTGIAEQLRMSRTTVRKYVVAGAFPERSSHKPQQSILDPYIPYLQQRILDGCYNASLLQREIQAQGFSGGYTVVRKWLEGLREQPGRLSSQREQARKNAFFGKTGEIASPAMQASQPQEQTESTIALQVPLESPRHLVWLLLRDPLSLNDQEQQMLAFIWQEQDIEVAYRLAQQFGTMVRKRQRDHPDAWMSACLASRIPDLETFAEGLQKDYPAIIAALTLPYSNGPVEGHVNRLKFIKRSMYGRGDFELLRQRVLKAA